MCGDPYCPSCGCVRDAYPVSRNNLQKWKESQRDMHELENSDQEKANEAVPTDE